MFAVSRLFAVPEFLYSFVRSRLVSTRRTQKACRFVVGSHEEDCTPDTAGGATRLQAPAASLFAAIYLGRFSMAPTHWLRRETSLSVQVQPNRTPDHREVFLVLTDVVASSDPLGKMHDLHAEGQR